MSGYISEFFGYRAEDSSDTALQNTSKQVCPFLSSYCTKALGDRTNRTLSGVCAVRQVTSGSPNVICCPNRIYAENYKMLSTIARKAFVADYNLYSGRLAVSKLKRKTVQLLFLVMDGEANCLCQNVKAGVPIMWTGF